MVYALILDRHGGSEECITNSNDGAEDIWDGWSSGSSGSIDRHILYIWGVRYIDDLAYRLLDNNADEDYIDTGDRTFYAITDVQFSVRAMINNSGALVEWVEYSPYGEARNHHRYDVDGDGDFDSTDKSIVQALYNTATFPETTTDIDEFGYRAEADINRDGTISSADSSTMGTSYASAVSAGLISAPGGIYDNIIGYDGYVFNSETMEYCVRFRTYLPPLGRWGERDPFKYVNGMSLVQYTVSNPCRFTDPLGLCADEGGGQCTPQQDGECECVIENQALVPYSLGGPEDIDKIDGILKAGKGLATIHSVGRGVAGGAPGVMAGCSFKSELLAVLRARASGRARSGAGDFLNPLDAMDKYVDAFIKASMNNGAIIWTKVKSRCCNCKTVTKRQLIFVPKRVFGKTIPFPRMISWKCQECEWGDWSSTWKDCTIRNDRYSTELLNQVVMPGSVTEDELYQCMEQALEECREENTKPLID